MAFEAEVAANPTELGDIEVVITFNKTERTIQARYATQIEMSDGTIRHRSGDLWNELSDDDRQVIVTMMGRLRRRMRREKLPALPEDSDPAQIKERTDDERTDIGQAAQGA